MKIFIKNIALSMVLLAACRSENVDINYVKANSWQYDVGFKIGDGDFISFDSNSKIFYLDTNYVIYFKGHPRAIIKKVDKKRNEIIIESLDEKKQGVYININEFTK